MVNADRQPFSTSLGRKTQVMSLSAVMKLNLQSGDHLAITSMVNQQTALLQRFAPADRSSPAMPKDASKGGYHTPL